MEITNSVEIHPFESRDNPADTTAEGITGRIQATYHGLGPGNLDGLTDLYCTDVCFEDPIHGIQGLPALINYFEHMYRNVESAEFKFHRTLETDNEAFLSWTMLVRHRQIKQGQVIRVEGASYVKVRDNKIYYHRDYYDLGAMAYEHIPVFGRLISWIRRRLVA